MNLKSIFFWGLTLAFLIMLITKYSCEDYSYDANTRIMLPLDEMEQLYPQNKYLVSSKIKNARYTMVTYLDSLLCSPCEFKKIGDWNKYIEKTVETSADIDFVFIYSPTIENRQKLRDAYSNTRFPYYIYIDSLGAFEKCNAEVKDKRILRSLLINQDGKIEFIGNPTKNVRLEYKFYEYCHQQIN